MRRIFAMSRTNFIDFSNWDSLWWVINGFVFNVFERKCRFIHFFRLLLTQKKLDDKSCFNALKAAENSNVNYHLREKFLNPYKFSRIVDIINMEVSFPLKIEILTFMYV